MLKTCVNSAWSPSPLGVDNWPVIAAHQSILKIHTIHSATVGDHIWHNYFSGPFIHASLSDLGKMIPDQCHYPTVSPTDNIDLYHWQSRRCFSPVTEAHGRSADAACLFQCSWYGRRQSLWCLLTEMPPAEHGWLVNKLLKSRYFLHCLCFIISSTLLATLLHSGILFSLAWPV